MVNTCYLVVYLIHNGQNNAWDYRISGRFDNLSLAKKEYFLKLSQFVGSDVYDNVAVMILDSYGNRIDGEWWTSIESSPAITITSITKEGNVYTITYSDGTVETFIDESEEEEVIETP